MPYWHGSTPGFPGGSWLRSEAEQTDEGLVLLTPEIPGEPSEAVRQERGGNGLKRIRGFAHSGDSFRRSRFRRASGGPIFSVLPEKMGEKRGAGVRLVRTAGAVQAGT